MIADTQSPIRIRAGQTNLYLLSMQEGLLLVDAGTRGSLKRLEQGLTSHKLHPEDIRLIVITHTHYDHVGGLREIVDKTRARVLVHAAEADCLRRGFTPFPRGTGPFSKGLSLLGRRLMRKTAGYAPVHPDIVIDQALDLGPYGINGHIALTPGHTEGSLSIMLQDAALVGDTLFHVPPWRIYPPFANDETALAQSWKHLLKSGCQTFYPAHGAPISRKLFERRAEGIEQRAKGRGSDVGDRRSDVGHRRSGRGGTEGGRQRSDVGHRRSGRGGTEGGRQRSEIGGWRSGRRGTEVGDRTSEVGKKGESGKRLKGSQFTVHG